jgi:hypothetical protein
MDTLSLTDKIWNRALENSDEALLSGDLALSSMLIFHSVAMNGGIVHAIECVNTAELPAIQAGYRFFDLHAVALLLIEVKNTLKNGNNVGSLENYFDIAYAELIPDDDFLVKRFEAVFKLRFSEFSPI